MFQTGYISYQNKIVANIIAALQIFFSNLLVMMIKKNKIPVVKSRSFM